MVFKRTEGFRFTFGVPIEANFTELINGKQEQLEVIKYPCEIIDVSPHGMKMFSSREIGENNNNLVQLELEFILDRSEEHTSELQSRENLVCRLLLEKKKK